MKIKIHMCQSIAGPLRTFKDSDWKHFAKCCTTDDNKPMSGEKVKEYFLECLAKGWKVMPLGEPCEGFSYQTGCPGHPVADDPKHWPADTHGGDFVRPERQEGKRK